MYLIQLWTEYYFRILFSEHFPTVQIAKQYKTEDEFSS